DLRQLPQLGGDLQLGVGRGARPAEAPAAPLTGRHGPLIGPMTGLDEGAQPREHPVLTGDEQRDRLRQLVRQLLADAAPLEVRGRLGWRWLGSRRLGTALAV